MPDATDAPDLKALFDPNWTLLDGVIPNGQMTPKQVGPASVPGTPGARASAWDHTHQGQHQLVGGLGFNALTEEPAMTYVSVPTANTTLYTAPADCIFALCALGYFYNSTGAAITVTVRVGGVQILSKSVPANGVQAVTPPPLRPGETYQVSATAVGVNFYGPVYECRDPSWNVVRIAPAAGASTLVFAPAAGLAARSIYIANITNAMWAVNAAATTVLTQYKPSGGATMTVGTNALTALNAAVLAPVMLELAPGDAAYVQSTAAGSTVWGLFQSFDPAAV